jgi:hypothetical protein
MQGTAGIVAYLFRLARVLEDGPGAPVVDRPDQWWAVPADVRTIGPADPIEHPAASREPARHTPSDLTESGPPT